MPSCSGDGEIANGTRVSTIQEKNQRVGQLTAAAHGQQQIAAQNSPEPPLIASPLSEGFYPIDSQRLVSGKNYRPTLTNVLLQQLFKLSHTVAIDSGKGFIQHPQFGTTQVKPRQCHPPLLTGGKAVTGNIFITL